MTFTRVGVIVVITAIAVYFGLNLLLPRNTAEQKAASATTPDQVFSTTADATPAPPATPADNAPAAPAAAAAPATSSDTPPPAAETAASGGSSSASAPASAPAQGLSEEEARKIAEEVGRKVATQVASSVVQNNQPSSQPATETAPAADTAAAGSSSSGSTAEAAPAAAAPAEAPAPAAAAEAAPAAEAPAPKPKKSRHASETASTDSGTAAKPAKSTSKAHGSQKSMDAISNWWPATQSDGKLNLLYAGEAASVKAAALLFSDNIGNAATAGSHIQILDGSGKPAAGQWEASPQNARLLIFKTKPGRYTVILAPELAGLSGKTLGTGLHGPVYVH